jgi:hypothetical protein
MLKVKVKVKFLSFRPTQDSSVQLKSAEERIKDDSEWFLDARWGERGLMRGWVVGW